MATKKKAAPKSSGAKKPAPKKPAPKQKAVEARGGGGKAPQQVPKPPSPSEPGKTPG